jgi:hypothetical protein
MSDLHSYLFLYSALVGDPESIRDFIDSRPEIVNWQIRGAYLRNAMVLVSNKTPNELSDIIRGKFSTGGFIVARLDGSASNGWLPKEMWDFINNPKPVK